MSRASTSHSGRSGNPNVAGSNPDEERDRRDGERQREMDKDSLFVLFVCCSFTPYEQYFSYIMAVI